MSDLFIVGIYHGNAWSPYTDTICGFYTTTEEAKDAWGRLTRNQSVNPYIMTIKEDALMQLKEIMKEVDDEQIH